MSAGLRKIFLVVLMLAGGALFAADYDYNVDMVTGADADIKLTVPGGQMPRAGFLPVRVRVNNRSSSERSWRLELGSTMGSGRGFQGGALLNWAGNLAVPGGSTREFFLFVPVMLAQAGRFSGIQVNLDGPQVARSGFALGLDQGWGSSRAPLAVEPGLEARLNDILVAQASAGSAAVTAAVAASRRPVYRRPSGSPKANIGVIDPLLWPADWRLWSSFSTVLLDQATWERLDTARRRALLDYVALGGQLVRVNGVASREQLGAGLIVTLPGPMRPPADGLLEVLRRDASRSNEPALSPVNEDFWKLSPAQWRLGGQHRWLTGCILVFGLLIGPVNLFYFAPAGRRHRLFLTVPVISIVSALLLFGIITIKDGFGGAGTRRGVVVLQPAQNQAVVFQQQISRTGLLGSRKFPLPGDTIMNLEADETEGTGASPELWREGDGAAGDWFTSRSLKLHSLRRLVPTRERVELVGSGGSAPVVQSTVSGTLRDFLFMDQAGKMWTASEVSPGKRVTLVAPPSNYALGRHDTFKHLANQPMARGTFYALGGADGLIPTLPAVRWRDDVVLYTGRLEPNPEAAP